MLLTGASTGLGLAIARRLLDTPTHLILTARASSLARFAGHGIAENERVWLRPLDVTHPGERAAIVQEADERLGGIDTLVNNAGVAYRSVVEHVSDEDRVAQMSINFNAPMELARAVLPGMRRKRRGRIINVSSVGGMMAMPTMSVYSASKWALEGASEALYYEVRPWNIHVTLVEPGFINSPSFENVRYTALSSAGHMNADEDYYNHYCNMEPFISRTMKHSLATADSVARHVLRVMRQKRPPLRVYATPDAALFAMLRRLLPRSIYHEVLYRSLPHIRQWGRKNGKDAPE